MRLRKLVQRQSPKLPKANEFGNLIFDRAAGVRIPGTRDVFLNSGDTHNHACQGLPCRGGRVVVAVAVFVAVSLAFSLKSRGGCFCFFGRGRSPRAHFGRPPPRQFACVAHTHTHRSGAAAAGRA